MRIRLILVPYVLGMEKYGCRKSPDCYMEAGVVKMLEDRDFVVRVERVELDRMYDDEVEGTAAVNQKLAPIVRDAVGAGEFPLVLAGSCEVSVGILAGIDHSKLAVTWFDAHGDFNTPETSPSGSMVGMPLAVVTGDIYPQIWPEGSNNTPLAKDRVMMVGVRALDPGEAERVEEAGIPVVAASSLDEVEGEAQAWMRALAGQGVGGCYVHVDIDGIDPEEAPGIDFPAPGGPSVAEVEQAVEVIAGKLSVKAASISAYNPDLDKDGKTLQAGMKLIKALAECGKK